MRGETQEFPSLHDFKLAKLERSSSRRGQLPDDEGVNLERLLDASLFHGGHHYFNQDAQMSYANACLISEIGVH